MKGPQQLKGKRLLSEKQYWRNHKAHQGRKKGTTLHFENRAAANAAYQKLWRQREKERRESPDGLCARDRDLLDNGPRWINDKVYHTVVKTTEKKGLMEGYKRHKEERLEMVNALLCNLPRSHLVLCSTALIF